MRGRYRAYRLPTSVKGMLGGAHVFRWRGAFFPMVCLPGGGGTGFHFFFFPPSPGLSSLSRASFWLWDPPSPGFPALQDFRVHRRCTDWTKIRIFVFTVGAQTGPTFWELISTWRSSTSATKTLKIDHYAPYLCAGGFLPINHTRFDKGYHHSKEQCLHSSAQITRSALVGVLALEGDRPVRPARWAAHSSALHLKRSTCTRVHSSACT